VKGWRVALGVAVGVATLGAAPGPRADADPSLRVLTDRGAVVGLVDGGEKEWRGIPYAAPPVGDLRFRPPARHEAWAGDRDATAFADQCIQLISNTETEGSEDCLYLNVFAPASSTPTSDLPVMVHLHPGSNGFGHAHQDASTLTRHGVIVVTVGYRLGALGWVGHPALDAEVNNPSGEYGILDQIAALRWVRRNIAGFGGDPGNLTLFGSSAGGFDATAIITSPLAQGLVQRAAIQTESVFAWRGEPIRFAREMGLELSEAVGCAGAADVAACLRATPAEDLVVAIGLLDVAPWEGGRVLPRSPRALMRQQPDPIPLLIGSDREEASLGWFFDFIGLDQPYGRFWYRIDTNAILGTEFGAAIRNRYPARRYDAYVWAGVDVFTDAIYACPQREVGLRNAGPVYRYVNAHPLDNDDFLAEFRATHIIEEPLLWGPGSLFVPDYELSTREVKLSDRITTYWTNFARTGNPNSAALPFWPRFHDDLERILVLDTPIHRADGYHEGNCEFLDGHPVFPEDTERAPGAGDPEGYPEGYPR
jgi:para-nitrobenzyl esterase